MLVIIAIGVVISYWPIGAAKIDLSNPGITLTELDEFSEFDHGELVRMLYSELKILKKEQKAMISVQNKLLATQEELRNRVNELETNNIHLQRQFENLLNSCGTKKNYESNLMADFKLHGHGNATERNIANTPKKRAVTTKTGMVRGLVPLHVAFLVRLTNTKFPFAPGHTVIFDNLYENVGNAYNPHNGIFRAPVTGLYIVLFTVASEGVRTPDIEVVRDGTVLCRAVTLVHYSSSSCNAIVHLNAENNVWARVVWNNPESKIRGSYFSTFSMAMISSDGALSF